MCLGWKLDWSVRRLKVGFWASALASSALLLAACDGAADEAPTTDPGSATQPDSAVASGGLGLVIAPDREYGGEEGGIVGSVTESDGCLGIMDTGGTRGVLSLPPRTEAIAGGARLTDGTELVVGTNDVFVGGTWVGPHDPDFPASGEECLGDSVFLVFSLPLEES